MWVFWKKSGKKTKKMSFFLGLVLGVAFGVGLVIAFVHSENSRSKQRTELVRKNHGILCLDHLVFVIDGIGKVGRTHTLTGLNSFLPKNTKKNWFEYLGRIGGYWFLLVFGVALDWK